MYQDHRRITRIARLLIMHALATDFSKARVVSMKDQFTVLLPIDITGPRDQLCSYSGANDAHGARQQVTFLHSHSQ